MKKLLIIDPQNDFCDIPGAALPVAGASTDMQRLTAFMAATPLDGITVTLDSHPSVAVERTTFWQTADGSAPAPFSFVTRDDVSSGKLTPRDATLTPQVLTMLDQLARAGRPGLVVWPVHCVTGTWGHNIYSTLADQLAQWEFRQQRAVRKVLKGEYPLTEHFGVFEADAPDEAVPSTQFNNGLATELTLGVDVLFIAGEAGSHCVASSFDQLARYLNQQGGPRPRVILLSDCMSPVTGFEADQQAFVQRATAWGAETMTSAQAGAAFK
ncbi:isochorismatase family protein [uncultured Rhodoferax sp.]|uniref:isochorismatase family protein n=1 Tax=uncultured Rhodoferax sp. TaxID=223188 RepID=UPI0025CCB95F|nr:isochorismatase family protein [uncultured Rhodoferax sp.]